MALKFEKILGVI